MPNKKGKKKKKDNLIRFTLERGEKQVGLRFGRMVAINISPELLYDIYQTMLKKIGVIRKTKLTTS